MRQGTLAGEQSCGPAAGVKRAHSERMKGFDTGAEHVASILGSLGARKEGSSSHLPSAPSSLASCS